MTETRGPSQDKKSLSGRRGQAARNDETILAAAREVFLASPHAPIGAVAERAGVGISALYRRYPSKEELLRQLCRDGLKIYIAEAEAALADEGDPWEAFATFIRRVVIADTNSLTMALAGTFTPSEDLFVASGQAQELNEKLFERTQRAGVLREGFEVFDLAMIYEQMAVIRLGDEARTAELRLRYLEVILTGLRAGAPALTGTPPSADELGQRWIPR